MDHNSTLGATISEATAPSSPSSDNLDTDSPTITEWAALGLGDDDGSGRCLSQEIILQLAANGVYYFSQILATCNTGINNVDINNVSGECHELMSWYQFRHCYRGPKKSPTWFHQLQSYASGVDDYAGQFCRSWGDAKRASLEASDRESSVNLTDDDEADQISDVVEGQGDPIEQPTEEQHRIPAREIGANASYTTGSNRACVGNQQSLDASTEIDLNNNHGSMDLQDKSNRPQKSQPEVKDCENVDTERLVGSSNAHDDIHSLQIKNEECSLSSPIPNVDHQTNSAIQTQSVFYGQHEQKERKDDIAEVLHAYTMNANSTMNTNSTRHRNRERRTNNDDNSEGDLSVDDMKPHLLGIQLPDECDNLEDWQVAPCYGQELHRILHITPPPVRAPRPWVKTPRLVETMAERLARKRAFVKKYVPGNGSGCRADIEKEFHEIDFERRERKLDQEWQLGQKKMFLENEKKSILQEQADWMQQRDDLIGELKDRWFHRRAMRLYTLVTETTAKILPQLQDGAVSCDEAIDQRSNVEGGAQAEGFGTTSVKLEKTQTGPQEVIKGSSSSAATRRTGTKCSAQKTLEREISAALQRKHELEKMKERMEKREERKRARLLNWKRKIAQVAKQKELKNSKLVLAAKERFRARQKIGQKMRQRYLALEGDALEARLMEDAMKVLDKHRAPLAANRVLLAVQTTAMNPSMALDEGTQDIKIDIQTPDEHHTPLAANRVPRTVQTPAMSSKMNLDEDIQDKKVDMQSLDVHHVPLAANSVLPTVQTAAMIASLDLEEDTQDIKIDIQSPDERHTLLVANRVRRTVQTPTMSSNMALDEDTQDKKMDVQSLDVHHAPLAASSVLPTVQTAAMSASLALVEDTKDIKVEIQSLEEKFNNMQKDEVFIKREVDPAEDPFCRKRVRFRVD
ncbi:hypothetical protein BG004_000086 [Podila humilis]|nr:hypothetical protein BG004_000086 [Podila humilis]